MLGLILNLLLNMINFVKNTSSKSETYIRDFHLQK